MSRAYARDRWHRSKLSYSDLKIDDLVTLRTMIDEGLQTSGFMRGTYRTEKASLPREHDADGRISYAEIRCRAYYFRNREAVTFNKDGFIGFAGWADDENVGPIVDAFVRWVDMMCSRRTAQRNAA